MQDLRKPGRRSPFLMLAILFAAAGCGSGEAQPGAGKATFATDADEAAALDRGPRAGEALLLVPALAATGAVVFDTKGCTGCHALGESTDAPDLRGVTARRTEAWLRRQITDPVWMAEHDPVTRQMVGHYGTAMTALEVTNDETTALLQFLLREGGGP